jgi:hypothetical protein
MAGGGIKAGARIGETDKLGFNVTKERVHVHDLNATMLKLLGFDHTRLTYKFQRCPFRLTDVEGTVVEPSSYPQCYNSSKPSSCSVGQAIVFCGLSPGFSPARANCARLTTKSDRLSH